jgi:hypothetical protein
MAAPGDRVRVVTTVGPTALLSEVPIVGRVLAVSEAEMSVLWENGVVSENLPSGAGFVEIITDPSEEAVNALFLRFIRYKTALREGTPRLYGYTAGLYTLTLDEPDAPARPVVLMRTLAGTYCEFASDLCEEVPGYIGTRPDQFQF